MTSVMRSGSDQHPDYPIYQDMPQQLPPQVPQPHAQSGLSENSAYPEGSLDRLDYLPGSTDQIFGQDANLPISSAPSNSFDVDFELDLASNTFPGNNAATAAFGGGELKFPELPADLLDSSPEYEYSHHTRTNVFDAAQDFAGDEEANRVFGLDSTYDPTGPLPADEDLFGLAENLGAELNSHFNPTMKLQPSDPQLENFYNQPQDHQTSHRAPWGPSPASSFSNSTAQTPINGELYRSFDDAEREAKRRRESYDYPPPPPLAAPSASITGGQSPAHLNSNGYPRGTPVGGDSSGTNTPVRALYSHSSYPNSSLTYGQRTWNMNDPTGRNRVPQWEDPQRAYYPALDYSGPGGMYVSSTVYGNGGLNDGTMPNQRDLGYTSHYPIQSHQPVHSAPRLGAGGASSYIPDPIAPHSNHLQPQAEPHPHAQPQNQSQARPQQPRAQSQTRAPANSTNRIPVSVNSVASLLPDTFVGPGGIPVPAPGQTQIEMIDAIGSAVDASVQSDGIAQCPYPNCNKTFARNRTYNLKAHLRAHSQLKPFACTDCPRAFSRRHDLERHARVHTGDKPYVCEVCQKGFPRSDALRRHWRVEVECGQKAQEMEKEKEAERRGEPSRSDSSHLHQHSDHPQQSQEYPQQQPQDRDPLPQSRNGREPEAPTSAPSGGRSTRNSSAAGNKRKR